MSKKRKHITLTRKLAAALREQRVLNDCTMVLKFLTEHYPTMDIGVVVHIAAAVSETVVAYDHAKGMSAKQLNSLFTFDHNIQHGIEVVDEHWNLTPRRIKEHREKSKKDAKIIAKSRRVEDKYRGFTTRMKAKAGVDTSDIPEAGARWFKKAKVVWPKGRKLQSRGFQLKRP